MNVGLPFVVVVAILAVVFFVRHREPARRARFLRRAGFGLMAMYTAFVALFVGGETISDPGGWKAAGLIAAWAAPLVALGIVTWYRSGWAVRAFAVLIAAVIGLSVWFAAEPGSWRAFENRNGPIRDVVVFALSAAIGLLGLKRTTAAGIMLLVVGIVPVTVSSLASHAGLPSLLLVSSPPVIAGVLYLVSGAISGRSAPPGTGDTGPQEEPRAA